MTHLGSSKRAKQAEAAVSKTDAEGEGEEIVIWRGQSYETCVVAALQRWLTAAEIAAIASDAINIRIRDFNPD